MPLLNYTTSIASAKTIGEIQSVLAKHNARSIAVDYHDGEPTGITFMVQTPVGERSFALPANVAGVERVLRKQLGNSSKASTAQAARVAFRILKDWVEAQMAIIDAGMTTLDEVFLPYLILPSGQSMYGAFKENELKLLSA